jgi:ankyrin repeat protein
LDWAKRQQTKVPTTVIEQRKRDRLTILSVLLSHNPDLDADDGYGATALYAAIYEQQEVVAKELLRFGAKVNTKTGVYIDGPGDETPLHRAYWSPELTELLLKKGADPNAKTSTGQTPLDWAKLMGDSAVVSKYRSR